MQRPTLFLLIIAVLLLLSAAAPAQGPQRRGYFDAFDNPQIADEKSWALPAGAAPAEPRLHAGSIDFQVTYLDVVQNTNAGFDHPTRGLPRRVLVQNVLAYIRSVLNETGDCEIRFNVSMNNSASSLLASAGPFFELINGFSPGDAYYHIKSGVDPASGFPDITATVNFGHNWNEDLVPPGFDEVDLFSVLLHELTHGLGIISLSTSTGESEFDDGPGGTRTFSRFDSFLYTGTGQKLWSNSGTFLAGISALTGGQGGVFFRGPLATSIHGSYPRIYTPSPFEPASSIAHWNQLNGAVMNPTLSDGTMRREYRTFELGALDDLGYDVILPSNAAADWERWN